MSFHCTVVSAVSNADKVIQKCSGYSSVDNTGSLTAFEGRRGGQ